MQCAGVWKTNEHCAMDMVCTDLNNIQCSVHHEGTIQWGFFQCVMLHRHLLHSPVQVLLITAGPACLLSQLLTLEPLLGKELISIYMIYKIKIKRI